MKSSKLILALWLGACACALALPQKPQANSPAAVKPRVAAATPSAPSPKTSAPSNGAKASAPPVSARDVRVQGKPSPDSHAQSSTRVAAPHASTHVAPVPGTAAPSSARAHGRRARTAEPHPAKAAVGGNGKPEPSRLSRRDPFVSPVVERIRQSANCTGTGRQCLLVGEISLRGIVRAPSGNIAVVVNGNHTYFLRDNDPLANGTVERINNDAVILRERFSDTLGRPLTREVTRKIGAPAD